GREEQRSVGSLEESESYPGAVDVAVQEGLRIRPQPARAQGARPGEEVRLRPEEPGEDRAGQEQVHGQGQGAGPAALTCSSAAPRGGRPRLGGAVLRGPERGAPVLDVLRSRRRTGALKRSSRGPRRRTRPISRNVPEQRRIGFGQCSSEA